jgi:hypothetical protein
LSQLCDPFKESEIPRRCFGFARGFLLGEGGEGIDGGAGNSWALNVFINLNVDVSVWDGSDKRQ